MPRLLPLLVLATAALIGGCATPPKPPERPTGPSAIVADSAVGGGRNGAAFFFVAEADGQPVTGNSLQRSMSASQGRGPNLLTQSAYRYLPAGKTRLKLSGRYAFAAPIQTLFSSAASYQVEGIVDVELRADGEYRVNGVLDPFRREIWLEDQATGARIGDKIVALPDAAALAASTASGLYTCCNLHYEGDWISDANLTALPMIPAGSRIAVNEYGSNRAAVTVEGRPMRLGLDYGREKHSVRAFVAQLAVKDDPRLRIAAFPPPVQAAIAAGKLMLGMTKEQVLISLGHPRIDTTPSLDASEWRYSTQGEEDFVLRWDADQRLREVAAEDWVKSLVLVQE
jgi:hypothetical protein